MLWGTGASVDEMTVVVDNDDDDDDWTVEDVDDGPVGATCSVALVLALCDDVSVVLWRCWSLGG